MNCGRRVSRHRVVLLVVTRVSEEYIAFIFRVGDEVIRSLVSLVTICKSAWLYGPEFLHFLLTVCCTASKCGLLTVDLAETKLLLGDLLKNL